MATSQDNANFIWQVADDILRGHFRPHEYGDVILPFVLMTTLFLVVGCTPSSKSTYSVTPPLHTH